MAMVSLANSDFGRILFGTLFLGKLKETGEFKKCAFSFGNMCIFCECAKRCINLYIFFASDDAKLPTKLGLTCGVLTVLMSKTLGNINVDWHNLILSRLCTLDTCAIGDKILSTDWQLSC